jgi:hypothetical protein
MWASFLIKIFQTSAPVVLVVVEFTGRFEMWLGAIAVGSSGLTTFIGLLRIFSSSEVFLVPVI